MCGGTDVNLTSVYDTCAVINVCVRGEGGVQGRRAAPSLALLGCSVSGGCNANGRQNQLPGQLCLEISDIADSRETFMWQLGKTEGTGRRVPLFSSFPHSCVPCCFLLVHTQFAAFAPPLSLSLSPSLNPSFLLMGLTALQFTEFHSLKLLM